MLVIIEFKEKTEYINVDEAIVEPQNIRLVTTAGDVININDHTKVTNVSLFDYGIRRARWVLEKSKFKLQQ